MTKLKIHIALILALAAFTSACTSEPPYYPVELTMADSAYMSGDYQRSDHLLEAYRPLPNNEQEHILNYHKLIELEQKFVYGILSPQDFSTADSLCRYYNENDTNEKYAKALLFLGDIIQKEGNYPLALKYYIRAQNQAFCIAHDNRVLCLTSRKIGELYLKQQLFKKSIPHFQDYYHLATVNHDTLRMAYASRFMATVSIINQEVDSAVYYLKQSMELGKGHYRESELVPYAMCDLCDIYIQTEQFDKALEIMPRDSLNDGNWAYWHYGQEHVDSAIYYFQRLLGRFKWQGETEVLSRLAHLEEQRGDLRASLAYFKQLEVAMDSLKKQQKIEETLRTEAQYKYSQLQQEYSKPRKLNPKTKNLVVLGNIVFFLIVIYVVPALQSYRQKKKAALARQRLLEHEKEEQQRQSQQKLEENRQKLAQLEQELAAARQQDDSPASERLQMEAEVLASQNQNIEARQRRKEALLRNLMGTALYQRLKAPAREGTKKMTEVEWQQLATSLDDIYDQFTNRLLQLAKLSETELRICYLLKIKVPPAEIADILCKSKSAITLARRRMYEKLTATRGKAEQLDELIQEL